MGEPMRVIALFIAIATLAYCSQEELSNEDLPLKQDSPETPFATPDDVLSEEFSDDGITPLIEVPKEVDNAFKQFATRKKSRGGIFPPPEKRLACGSCPLGGGSLVKPPPMKDSFLQAMNRDKGGWCHPSRCSKTCHCASRITPTQNLAETGRKRVTWYPKYSAKTKIKSKSMCCTKTKTIKGCSVSLQFCLKVKSGSYINGYNGVSCNAGWGICYGLYARVKFDVSVKLSASCSKSFTYEQAREITLFNAYGIKGVVIPGFKFTMNSGLKGYVKMTIPAAVYIRPDWFPSDSSAVMSKPKFSFSVSAKASVKATVSLGLEVNALGIVSAGFEASASIGGSGKIGLKTNGKAVGGSVYARVKVVFALKFFSLSLQLPSYSLCSVKLLDFGSVHLDSGLGHEWTLVNKKIKVSLNRL